jgi:hypothetical protein
MYAVGKRAELFAAVANAGAEAICRAVEEGRRTGSGVDAMPSTTTIGVQALYMPEIKVEIEMMVRLPLGGSRNTHVRYSASGFALNRHPCKSLVKEKARGCRVRFGERTVGLIRIYRCARSPLGGMVPASLQNRTSICCLRLVRALAED